MQYKSFFFKTYHSWQDCQPYKENNSLCPKHCATFDTTPLLVSSVSRWSVAVMLRCVDFTVLIWPPTLPLIALNNINRGRGTFGYLALDRGTHGYSKNCSYPGVHFSNPLLTCFFGGSPSLLLLIESINSIYHWNPGEIDRAILILFILMKIFSHKLFIAASSNCHH